MRRRRRDRGLALILALLVLAILIILISQMSITSLHNRTVAENHLGDLQNTYASRSGYHLATLYLEADLEKDPDVDHLQEPWAQPIRSPFGRSAIHVEIRDCSRFVNLSRLVDDEGKVDPVVEGQLRRLIRNLNHPPEVAGRIIDYIDADSRGDYEARARNERLFNPDELLRIEGLEPDVLYGITEEGGEERKGLLQFLTVWPRTTAGGASPSGEAVNVNTASVEILESLSEEMTPAAAAAILEHRSRPGADGRPEGIKDVAEIESLSGMTAEVFGTISDRLTVKSDIFEVNVVSRVRNIEKKWVYVVRRSGGEGGKVELLASQRRNDFLSVRPPEFEE